MPNGRGALECCYCFYYRARNGGLGYPAMEGRCTYWSVDLPVISDHRICADFKPNAAYMRANAGRGHWQTTDESVRERMSWFGRELKPGVLYSFCYNVPPGITELMELTSTQIDSTGNE